MFGNIWTRGMLINLHDRHMRAINHDIGIKDEPNGDSYDVKMMVKTAVLLRDPNTSVFFQTTDGCWWPLSSLSN